MSLTLKARGTELRVAPYDIRAAALGSENPFPPMEKTPRSKIAHDDPKHRTQHHGLRIGYGKGGTLLPYTMQDGYTRALKRQRFNSVVLENRFLRATFLPELGGRLWSLYHKAGRRELLDVNPVIQLGNLGYRDAWFAGGVEWNVCQLGYHTPLTCSPMFAGVLRLRDGTPVLRLWEWERRREMAYQIDAWLPADSPFLRVRFRLHNGHAYTLPVYEWSNIAVDETPDTRVISPADRVFINQYDLKGLRTTREALPTFKGVDITHPTNGHSARDYFFNVKPARQWITALRSDGKGLIQTSTSRQIGRKLFIWGMAPGGRRWQEYLAVPGHNYIEIQAGLASTQLESVPMPPGATWEWLEAYGLMEADATITHGRDWKAAYRHVGGQLDTRLPAATLERELRETSAMADQHPETMLMRGSGWGALERIQRESASLPMPWARGLAFDNASLGKDQAPWLRLLHDGVLPERAPTSAPGAYMVNPTWRKMLEASIARGDSDHWLGWFHLGVMRYDAADSNTGARLAWQQSMKLTPNPWAARCLARLAMRDDDVRTACALYERALRMRPHDSRLAGEVCDVLRFARRARRVLQIIKGLPKSAQGADRVQLAKAWAALDLGDSQTAIDIITSREFACIREGELSLPSIWFRAHEIRLSQADRIPITRSLRLRVRKECPPPWAIDMRMNIGTAEEDVSYEEHVEAKLERRRQRALGKSRSKQGQ
ncbi:MAG: DUF5107 domain-containing protein [Lentisphaerae bacterium]|nr:DUF5107 domain-containing protein [Lentisphaerota bacterium]